MGSRKGAGWEVGPTDRSQHNLQDVWRWNLMEDLQRPFGGPYAGTVAIIWWLLFVPKQSAQRSLEELAGMMGGVPQSGAP